MNTYTWRVEFDTPAGVKSIDVAADVVMFVDGRAEFLRGNQLVAWIRAAAVISATAFPGRLAEGGIIKRPVPWRRQPESEEDIFAAPGQSPYRMRFDSDPIGEAAREAAKRFEPKVTSTEVDRSTEARWVQGHGAAAVDVARGELGGRCA